MTVRCRGKAGWVTRLFASFSLGPFPVNACGAVPS
jgi:hypothetical protein